VILMDTTITCTIKCYPVVIPETEASPILFLHSVHTPYCVAVQWYFV